jgi:hypothetical protein
MFELVKGIFTYHYVRISHRDCRDEGGMRELTWFVNVSMEFTFAAQLFEAHAMTFQIPDSSSPSSIRFWRPCFSCSFDPSSLVSSPSSHFEMVEFINVFISSFFPSCSLASLVLFDEIVADIICFSFSSDCILASTEAMSMFDPVAAAFMDCSALLTSPLSSVDIIYIV